MQMNKLVDLAEHMETVTVDPVTGDLMEVVVVRVFQRKNVEQLRKNDARVFQDKYAEQLASKTVKMFQDKNV